MKVRYRCRSSAGRLLLGVLAAAVLCAAALALWRWYDSTVDRSGWVRHNGVVSYRDFHGKRVTGWLDMGQVRYYFDDDYAMVTGWQELDGERYCFGQDGILLTSWQRIDGSLYCFGQDGRLLRGWQQIDGQRYYLGTDGAAVSGWVTLEGDRYYLTEGVPASGWQEAEGALRCFSSEGILLTGWQELEGQRYFLREDGTPVTGTAELDGAVYCFSSTGAMVTGWQDTGEGRVYYLPQGPRASGWTLIGEKRYYFDEEGSPVTGWLQDGEYSYYLQEDGSAAVGPTKIGAHTHYFTPAGIHVVLVNAANPIPAYYKMDLVTVTGWHQVSSVCYDALVQMLADCTAAGIAYNFNSAHRTVAEQTMILDMRTEEYMDTGMSYEAARAKALQTVAYPGTSEHHLGLAVDLLGEEAVAWFTEHCWDYGFIVRYTAEKYPITGIIDEPWHFRYVGREVALDMKDSGLCLEEYLGAA